MKKWKEYLFEVNGFEIKAQYNQETVEKIFLPLLQKLTNLQKEKKRRIVVFMAAPPAVGKTTLCQFLQYLSQEEQGLTRIQALGLDGFHYHSEHINTHNTIVNGQSVPMKEVKGCPETYDTKKLIEKLNLISKENGKWPIYDRNIHDVVEDQILVREKIVIIEGNWLLLKEEPWKSISEKADYKIMILAEKELLKERLIERKEKGGLSREEAKNWYEKSDSKNVERVLLHSYNGDLTLEMQEDNDYIEK